MLGLLAWGFGVACAPSVVADYEAARSAALADAGPAPRDWKPDAVLVISGKETEELAGAVVAARSGASWQRSILGIPTTITPDLALQSLSCKPSKACAECFAIDAKLGGRVRYDVLGLGSAVEVNVHAVFDLAFVVTRQGTAFVLAAQPGEIRRVDVTLGQRQARLGDALGGAIEDWARSEVLGAEPTEIGRLGGDGVPLRAARVVARGDDVRVELLTTAAGDHAVAGSEADVDAGVRVWVDQGSLGALARAASFRAGPLSHDIVVEPTALAVTGDRFDLGLRLWKTTGRGWWRDYAVAGTVGVAGRQKAIQLTPDGVVEGPRSPRAGFADPLAALGEGIIVATIEDAIQTTLPVRQQQTIAGLDAKFEVTAVRGASNAVVVDGNITLSPANRGAGPAPSPGRRGSGSRPVR